MLWEKAARLAPLAALTAVTQRPLGELRADRVADAAASGHRRDVRVAPADGAPMLSGGAVGDDRGDARHADDLGRPRRCGRQPVRGRRHRRERGPRWARLGVPAPLSTELLRALTTAIALIGARSGSERVPGKNVRPLAGHPLLAYAIATAEQAGVFDRVLVSTDSEEIAAVARHYGADVPFLQAGRARHVDLTRHRMDRLDAGAPARALRPLRHRPCDQPVPRAGRDPPRSRAAARHARGRLDPRGRARQAAPGEDVDARADGRTMAPLLDQSHLDVAWHAGQYQALPRVYVQNSALEIAWTRVVTETGTREGRVLAPFLTQGTKASTWTTRTTGPGPKRSSRAAASRCPPSRTLRCSRPCRDPLLGSRGDGDSRRPAGLGSRQRAGPLRIRRRSQPARAVRRLARRASTSPSARRRREKRGSWSSFRSRSISEAGCARFFAPGSAPAGDSPSSAPTHR